MFTNTFRSYNMWIIRVGLPGLKQRRFDSTKRVEVVWLLRKKGVKGSIRTRSSLMLSWMCAVSRKYAAQYYIVTLVTHLSPSSALSVFIYLADNLLSQITNILQAQKLKLQYVILFSSLMHNFFIKSIVFLYMFRAILCSFSGGLNCIYTASGSWFRHFS